VVLALAAPAALATHNTDVKTRTTVRPTGGGFAGQLSASKAGCLKGRRVHGTLATRENRIQLGPVRSHKNGHWLLPTTVPSEDYFLQVYVDSKTLIASVNGKSCLGTKKIINTSAG
jgi:hypothetical protein